MERPAKNCQQSRTEAELVWTRATEEKWKHMAALGSTLEVTVAAYFQAGYEVENERVKKTPVFGVSAIW